MFVCLAGLVFFGQEGLRKSWNVAARVSSDGPFLLFAAFYLRVARQLREPNFSPSSSLLLLASYNVCSSKHPLCSPLLFLFLSSFFFRQILEKSETAERGGWSATEASQRAHSGHCVRARNTIYRSPLWAPWKQSQYWSPKWTCTAVFIVRSLSIKIRGGEKQLFQHILLHLLAYWLFCQSCVHLLECLGLENMGMYIMSICTYSVCKETYPGGSR